jgi:hypothetical protein
MLELAASFLIPIVKWLYERSQKRKLTDEEFVAMVLAHRQQREGAGQTVLDWRDSMGKLQAEYEKQKKERENAS